MHYNNIFFITMKILFLLLCCCCAVLVFVPLTMQSINDVALLCSGSFFNDGKIEKDPGLRTKGTASFFHAQDVDSPWHNLETLS